MGQVFLARDHAMPGADRLVVIKRIRSDLARDPHFVRLFLDEARINLRLSHPNIAYTFEVGQVESDYFIAMEFVHGENLRRLLTRHDPSVLTPSIACLIASRVAGALHHAHGLADTEGKPLHVVHRDVNPHNIRVSYEGTVKVLDFGIARAHPDPDDAEVEASRVGYVSPEQAAGGPVDLRSDIFSLGVVLHEMLAGVKLSSGRTVAPAQIAPPSRMADHPVPAALDEIVMTALAAEPDGRFPSARAMQESLDRVLHERPANDTDLRLLMATVFGEALSRKSQFLEGLRRKVSGEYRAIDFAQLEATKETFVGASRDHQTPVTRPGPDLGARAASVDVAAARPASPASLHASEPEVVLSATKPAADARPRWPLALLVAGAALAIAAAVVFCLLS